MKMLAFLFLAISLVVEITSLDSEESQEEMFAKWIDTCARELKVPQAKLDEYRSMNEPSGEKIENCLTACIFEKLEVMKDGKLLDHVITMFFDEFEDDEEMDEARIVDEKCQKKANGKSDKCEIAGAFMKCIYTEMHDT